MGKIGQGLRFDGSDDYVVTSVGSESLYDFERTSPFSISFWLKPVHTDTSNQIPISKSSDQDSNYSGFHWVNNLSCNYSANAPGSIAFAFVNAWGSNYLCVFSAGTLINQKSQWIHYAVTYSGSAQASGIKMYQNGVALSLTTGSIPNGNTLTSSSLNNYPVSFGARSDGSSSWHENYNGSMDDVRIYNRELSITEIQQLYNLGR